ncbi:MAG: UDP-N-acetylglucosamine 2-epimerase (non-hydrolyzing) [Candidatus Bathyarchaeia archaeon]
MRVATVIGTRPEIIKVAPLVPLLDEAFDHKIIYTGQHYDYVMSGIFFRELGLRKPDYKPELLRESSEESFKERLCLMLTKVREALEVEDSDLCIVLGDTDSTLIGALAAYELRIPVAHVEAGLRSFEMAIPEEKNRIVVDHLSTLLFAPSELAHRNLRCEGIDRNVHVVGNTIVDACLRFRSAASRLKTYEEYGLARKEYLVVTIHRESNTREERLIRILRALMRLEIPMVFPMHPRTRQKLVEMGFWIPITGISHIRIVKPMGYLEFLSLMLNARMILTDSGGIQEEAVTLRLPCLTIRESTERWETVQLGVNRLIGTEPRRIVREVRKAWDDEEWIRRVLLHAKNPYGEGRASEEIVSRLKELSGLAELPPSIAAEYGYGQEDGGGL